MNVLQELMKKKGITQAQLSNNTGINLSTIKTYCAGNAKPKLDKATILGKYFDVAPSLFMGIQEVKDISLSDLRFSIRTSKTLENERLSDSDNARLRHMAISIIDLIQDLNDNGMPEDIHFAKRFLEEFRFFVSDSLDPKEEGKKFEVHEASMFVKMGHINKLMYNYLETKPKM